jgi:EAL domain-containing protein (putative c-di-GMP-specific phosphodiesterase class I)/CheY-like chemotaxis protein
LFFLEEIGEGEFGSMKSVLEQIQKNCYQFIRANLTEDTYCILHTDEETGFGFFDSPENQKGLSVFWKSLGNERKIYQEDVLDVREYANLEFISEFFHRYHGGELFEIQFRCMIDDRYRTVHLAVVPAENYSDEQQNVYILIRKVGKKLAENYVQFDDLLRGLSENYSAIYYVDFERNTIHPFRMNAAIEKQFGAYFRTNPSYEDAIDAYISAVVSEQDKEELTAVTRYEFLREQLKDVLAYSHEYRVLRGGRELVFRFKVANLDGIGELRRAVIGFADVSAEKANDYSAYQMRRKILVADADEEDRRLLTEMLPAQYEVLVADNGPEALRVLGSSHADIAVVLVSLQMPDMDGEELIRQMKRVRQYSSIPVIGVTDSDEAGRLTEMESRCLTLGAVDFITRPYNPLIVGNRVRSVIQLQESTSILHSVEKDPLTNLYSKEFFYHRVEQLFKNFPEEHYLMWVTDIQGLKIINEKYGIETGDEILRIQAGSRDLLDGFVCGGRIEGDKLAALVLESALPSIREAAKRADMGLKFPIGNVVIKHGIYHIHNKTAIRPQGMYDRALLAMQKVKDTYGVNFAEYNDELRQDLLVQRQVVEEAEKALGEHQFVTYYQPKFDLHTGRTNGAEALVRWVHPEIGFMNPGVFIPVFEKNGFIRNVDYYVWEAVCRDIREWKDRGMRIVPISVNVSRRDFEDEELADKVITLLDKYGVDHSDFHIEVTESAYSDNPQQISKTVKKFHDNGFVIELDDFGTGYSSMSALSDLDLDVMKLDTSLIHKDNPGSGKNVLEFSMQLAKLLKLKTVAEGVETEAQVDRIISLGGDYIQGYYYSKPLPKEKFEEYLSNENVCGVAI